MSNANYQVVSLKVSKGTLELLCYQDAAIKWRENKDMSLENVLITKTIYSDAKQGERASEAIIQELGGTEKVITAILTSGHVALSTQERRKRVEEKKHEIAGFLHDNYLDNNNSVVPITQILAAIDQITGLKINPFVGANVQALKIMEALKKKKILILHPGGIEGLLVVPYSTVSKIQGAAAKIGMHFINDGDFDANGWSARFSVSPKGVDQLMSFLESACKGEYECHLLNETLNDANEEDKNKESKSKNKKRK